MRIFKSANHYHQLSKYSFNDIKSVYQELSSENKGYPVKNYQSKPSIQLPKSFNPSDKNFHSNFDTSSQFGLFHHLKSEKISINEISQLLYLANGITLIKEYGSKKISLRAAPSAGACYPIEIYLINEKMPNLEIGLYYYHPIEHSLLLLKEDQVKESIWKEAYQLDFIKDAPIYLIFSNTFSRNSWKYLVRGLRYSLLDCGYIMQNLNLAASHLGLTVNLLGDFCDQNLNKILDFVPNEEVSLLLAAIGKPEKALSTATYSFGMLQDEENISGAIPDPQQIFYLKSSHENSRDGLINIEVKLPFKKVPIKKKPLHDLIILPDPQINFSQTTFQIINKRRSVHNFQRISITLLDLSTLLNYIYKIPAMYNFPAYHTYVVVNDVENLSNGVYFYHPAEHKLELLKKGTFRGDLSYLTLAQDAVFNASVVIFFSSNFREIDIFSDRGYRYAHFNIGMASEAVYLIATALNLGVRGIGNYFDDELNTFFKLEDPGEQILGGVVVGKY
jgi:SagB-type dehydrogenase family enzyme